MFLFMIYNIYLIVYMGTYNLKNLSNITIKLSDNI